MIAKVPKIVINKLLCLVLLVLFAEGPVNASVLRAYISQHGLHGEIEFSIKNESTTFIRTNLQTTLQYPDQVWRWTLHEFPVDYTDVTQSRCSDVSLGAEVYDFTEELGYLILPGKDHAQFESQYPLSKVWGRSIVFESAERERVVCASVVSATIGRETHAVAEFSSPVAGSVHFRFLTDSSDEGSSAYILADLYHTRALPEIVKYTEHKWKLFVTDVFDSETGNHKDNCNVLQLVFDPKNNGPGLSVGDLDHKFGLVKVAADPTVQRTKTIYEHEQLYSLNTDMDTTKRSLYVVIYDHKHDHFLACAKMRLVETISAMAIINSDGVKGVVKFSQRSRFDPTWSSFNLSSADGDFSNNIRYASTVLAYEIRELPPKIVDADHVHEMCNTTGMLYNPTGILNNDIPPPGMGTQDQYPVGALLGKYKGRTEYLVHEYLLPGISNELSGMYWDVFLPLQGVHSVMHRALVIQRREPQFDICSTIFRYETETGFQTPLSSAEVIFRYPIVGRVIFRQPLGKPWEDTVILIESMIHADGANVNNTVDHRWAIHESPPGKDYYNWTGRCLSSGDLLEPYNIDVDNRHPEQYCRPATKGLCRMGDFTTRHGTLSVAGKKSDGARLTRRLFTDTAVALSGRYSILKKSLVIYDDHGPVARGERMACSIINGLYPRKGVIRDWFGNGESIPLRGRLELTQQSEYDVTNVQLTFEGLVEIRNYSIHVTPVERDLDFPCERSSLLDVYNPFDITKDIPPPAKGTADQYPVGDLSGKYGLLDGKSSYRAAYNDTQITLYGPHSILGRSLVLHKKIRARRWACSSIERGYSPAEARELRGIASFHNPGGFAYGYIRLTQLIHADGSQSDTIIEVKLRHPGLRDRNMTRNHKWEIFVNPVGVDATVKVTNTRCVAGGYRWNPYFTQLADPLNHELYSQECGADNPLRCHAGDLTSRLGTINLGGERQMFMDINFPLEGAVSAMGRSIVIFGPDRSNERFACANVEPDSDIIKYFNIMKPPTFVLRQFLDDVRAVMGVPEWMLGVDSRKTRELHHGTCLQILLHFMGPQANKLEFDFSSLMASGRLDAPSIYIPGYVNTKRKTTIAYQQCGFKEPGVKKKGSYFSESGGTPRATISSLSSALLLYTLARSIAVNII